MLIRRLILENFGLFRSRTEINLAPRSRHGKPKPVILVGGTNGAGKTTILDAIRLCLYGPLAVGERVSQEQYHGYLRECIHRDHGALFPLKSAAVAIEFEYGVGGNLHRFHVERAWDCNDNGTKCALNVTRDGAPLDQLEQAHADEFLRDLIPRGVSQLFFFDGEKIQEMAQAADDDVALADAIKGLLGLEVLDRLHSDLTIYVGRLRGGDASKSIKKELQQTQEQLDQLQAERLAHVKLLDRSTSAVDRLNHDAARVKLKLSREGASFADEREQLVAEEWQLREAIKKTEDAVREMCAGLLPFTLASELCLTLRIQLEAEQAIQDWQAYCRLLESHIAEIKTNLDQSLFSGRVPKEIDGKTRQRIIDRVSMLLDSLAKKPSDLPSVDLMHILSEVERKRLLSGIERVLDDVPRQLTGIEGELEIQTRRMVEVRGSLEKIPSDDVLAPLMKQLNDLNRKAGAAESEVKRREEELRSIDQKIETTRRLMEKKIAEIGTSKTDADRRTMVTGVQNVLHDYAAALTQSKISELSGAVADCFQQLWRKGDVLHRISIDPKTCTVMLLDRHDHVIPKERLSAGEKQIYAISMLWALARVSGRVLPMVIDTPLARLDSKHRHHLVTRYFPHVSHQVIILSTDTEIDQTYVRELSSSISHAYHLRFDECENRTVLEEGYFWGKKELEAVS